MKITDLEKEKEKYEALFSNTIKEVFEKWSSLAVRFEELNELQDELELKLKKQSDVFFCTSIELEKTKEINDTLRSALIIANDMIPKNVPLFEDGYRIINLALNK